MRSVELSAFRLSVSREEPMGWWTLTVFGYGYFYHLNSVAAHIHEDSVCKDNLQSILEARPLLYSKIELDSAEEFLAAYIQSPLARFPSEVKLEAAVQMFKRGIAIRRWLYTFYPAETRGRALAALIAVLSPTGLVCSDQTGEGSRDSSEARAAIIAFRQRYRNLKFIREETGNEIRQLKQRKANAPVFLSARTLDAVNRLYGN